MPKYHVFCIEPGAEGDYFPLDISEGINTDYMGAADSLEEAGALLDGDIGADLDFHNDYSCTSYFVRQITPFCYQSICCFSRASDCCNPEFSFAGWYLITEKDSIVEDDLPIDFGYYRELWRKSRAEKIRMDFSEEIRWKKN